MRLFHRVEQAKTVQKREYGENV